MKTLYVNYKSVVSTLVVLLMVLSVHPTGFAEVTPVSERTQQVQNAIVAALPSVTNASDVTETHLASITSLNLRNKDITALKSGDFSGLTGLTNLNLYGNQLSSLPNGIFEGLTALTTLRLGGNTTNPMLLTVSLEKVGDNQFKAVASIGAPFAIVLPVSATNGSISGDATTLTISKGSVESDAVTVTRTEGITAAVTANIGTLPSLPNNHYGYSLSKSDALPVEVISAESTPTIPSGADEIDTATPAIEPPPVTPVTPDPPDEVPENNAPTFTEGAVTKRSVAENTAANTNISTAVSATDSYSGDTLSYTLGGVDAASFDIDSATGQLKTKAALDYETKRVYAVTITVSDGSLTDTISVIISVINKADTVLDTSILSVSDRTPQVRDAIVAAVPGVTDAADVTATHLAAIASLNLRNKDISALKSGDFSGLSSMTSLNLYGNMLSSLPNGIFAGLTSLTSLRLGGNTVSPMPLIVWLEQVSNDMYKVSIPAGAPFDVAVPVVLVDGVLRETLRTVTISKGSVKSDAFRVPVVQSGSIVIGALPNLPSNHFGYVLTKSGACNLTPQVAAAITAVVPGVTDCRNLSETDLATITSLNLNNKSITSLRSDDFAALLSLTSLDLRNNQLSSLPDGIFSGLTGLTTLQLSGNTVDPIPLTVFLEKVGTNMVRATLPTGAPFDLTLPITVANGSLAGSVSNLMIAAGSVESAAVVVLRASNTTGAVTANIGTLPSLPATHNGYALAKSTGLPLEILRRINVAPVFTAGTTTTRSIAENTAADTNIGSAISATDANSGDTLSYTLSGADASSFSIVSTSGQLRTKAALDYETKSSYTVTITVSDGSLTDSITVTINITDVDENRAPVFTAGTTTTRSIAENTAADTNIGSAISATDANSGDTLTYTLSGADASSFSIVSTSGQLRTKAALDYETKSSYTVTITVSDGSLTDSITVTINITDVDENRAPVFTAGTTTTRSIAENTASGVNIGTAVSATDADTDTLTYSLGETDAASFAIDTESGQLKTSAALDYETKSSYSVTITVSDGRLTDIISVTIKVTDVDEKPATDDITTRDENVTTPVNNAPVFTDGKSATRTVAENTRSGVNIGSAVAATDAEGHTLTYSLSGTDAAAFSIDSSSGQLRTNASLDYETKSTYTITIIVSDGSLTDSITVTIKVTDVDEAPSNNAPVFSDGDSTTLTVAENTSSGVNIGSAVSATDTDDDTLTYSLGGTDSAAFSIDSSSGQLRTSASLDYETKSTYTVTIIVSDGTLTDSITVTIKVTDVDEAPSNNAPVFSDGDSTTLTVAENTSSGVNIGSAVSATDTDDDTLTYSLSGTDAAAFSIDSSSGQLRTSASLDYETKSTYTVTITVSDGTLTDSITVTIKVTDVDEAPSNNAPVFSDGDSTTLTVAENTSSGVNIGSAVSATDTDDDTLTYSLGGTDATAFSIDTATGQLKTKAALNYETKSSYTVTVTASDGSLTDSINVTINVTNVNEAPIFSDGTTTTRAIAENVGADINIGTVVAASDVDSTNLTYSLSGTDAAAFSLDTKTGQLKTKATLDYETKTSYTVTITVSDGSHTDIITVTINVTNLDETPSNNAPVLTDGDSTTRSVAENSISGTNIGAVIAATDADNNTLAYLLSGTDASSFAIDSTNGQLKTSAALDHETKASYTVTVTVSDGTTIDRITVTITVTDVNEAPVFADGSSITLSIAENTATGSNIGSTLSATDPDDDTLTWTLGGADAASFSIVGTSGQLRTKSALDYETKYSYSVTITVSDGSLTDTITVTINIMDVDENRAPAFSSDSTTRSVAENTSSGVDIGTAVAATDADDDKLTYILGGTDAAAFSIDSTSGQLRTKSALDYETKYSYSVTITVSDGSLTDTITVTINVTDVDENRAPAFASDSITRSVAENTGSGVDIGTAVAATDADNDTLIYTLDGTDAAAFSIDSTSGQLRTKSALDYETKFSYSVTISVSDDNGGSDSITVTINVTDVTENSAPVFTDGASTTRSVAENTAAGTNIGTSVAATDADNDTLIYTLDGTDAAAFSIVSTSGQLRTKSALDYETKFSYSVTISVSDDNGGSDSITVTINVTDVTENSAPVFTDGASTTRSIAENTAAGTNIGTSVAATDADNDTLIYTLDGTDTAAFSIDSTSGQLKTRSALDYETKFSYSVTISVSDDNGGSDSITVTINITDVTENSAPVFTDGASTTRSIAENTAAGTNIGTSVAATDADNDTLIYTLEGTNSASFAIVITSGQLQTKAALNYERKHSYSVIITVSDSNGGTDSITVTINITDVANEGTAAQNTNSAPTFTEGIGATRSVAENTAAGTNIGTAVAATDADNDELTYTLGGTNAASFSIVSTSGQLKTKSALDYETKFSYSVTILVSDGNGGSDSITVTINITDVTENSAPVFTDGDSVTRSIDEVNYAGTAVDTYVDLGSPIDATDADNDTLTYSFVNIGNNSDYFSINSSTGQLSGRRLDYEIQSSFTLTIKATDSNNASDTITVTVTINDINEVPTFSSDAATTLTVQEGTAASTDLGSAYTAYDFDEGDTITFSLAGTDASSFQINSSSTQDYTESSPAYSVFATGQLQTNASLDYAKNSYSVDVVATDTAGLTKTTSITINVVEAPDVGEAPDPAVSSRTQAVQDAIVAAVSGVSSASDITGEHLLGITSLSITGMPSLTSLSTGDFNGMNNLGTLDLSGNGFSSFPGSISGLGSLTSLDLSGNQLPTYLPDGIFSGLSLDTLDLSGNTGNPTIVLSIEKVTHSENDRLNQYYRVKVNTGAPFGFTLQLHAYSSGVNLRYGPRVSISAGSIYSDNRKATSYAPSVAVLDIGLEIVSPGDITLPDGHSGYTFRNSGDQPFEIIPSGGLGAPSQVGNADSQLPQTTELLSNFPNPFNPETWIPYQLAKPSDVSITIYDIRGNVVRQLDIGHQKVGFYTSRSRAAYWDGRNAVGERVANGVYFYLLKAGDYAATRKMLILK